LVEALLLFVIAAKCANASHFAQRIQFVDEDDAGRRLSRLLEQAVHTGGTHTNEHFDISDPEIEKNGTPASPAMALATRVLPVSGGPTNNVPLGLCASSVRIWPCPGPGSP
jgi:hypothetical protein